MKRNLIAGIILISAVALSSCSSTSQLAKSSIDDDVYYSQAKAGDRTEYINDPEYLAEQQANSDDYYYYGDYSSRINRFGYYSPFNYGSSIYSPYSSRFSIGLGMGYGGYGYDPFYSSYYGPYGMGLGLGYGGYYGGYGYSPYYDLGYGYDPFFYGAGYGYGGGFGYGMGYYGGLGTIYGGAGYTPQRARPTYAGGNDPAINRAIRSNLPSQNQAINGRGNGQGQSVNSINGSRNNNGTGARPVRESRPQQVERAPQQQTFSFPSNNSGGGGGGGNSGGGGGGGGGGGRPVRP